MSEKNNKNHIAIIGMACRFPGSRNYHEFWENLKNGVNSIKEIPPDRWDIGKYYSPDRNEPNKSLSKWCGLVEDFDTFDNTFFNISPREASHMDPQQRMVLEEAWHCIEDSGVSLKKLQEKKTAVYVGATTADYLQTASEPNIFLDGYTTTGNWYCVLANRISYKLGLSGISIALDTGCAASLSAIHEGVRLLRLKEADYCIAAGVNASFHPLKFISYSKLGILSPDGKTKSFDKDGNGFAPGEGVGVLLLQRLDDAMANKNHIHGIIKGCAENHNARSPSMTAPRVEAQRDVILAALDDAGLDPSSITYVETHGTGTVLGDPIEVEALTRAFQTPVRGRHFCKIGSVKTGIGHLESAAGVAGVIKILMMMRHKQIPPSLNFKNPNPVINFKHSPFEVAAELSEWHSGADGIPLRAGISAFGFGGANAHILLEEPPHNNSAVQEETSRGDWLFLLSAKTEKNLERMAEKWQGFLLNEAYPECRIEDICKTLMTGREAFPYRYGCLVSDKDDLSEKLRHRPGIIAEPDKRITCLRLGKLSWDDAGPISLFSEQNPLFRENLKNLERHLASIDRDLCKCFRQGIGRKSPPLWSFFAAHAYLATLRDLGVRPDIIIGESNGIWNSLVLAQVMTPEDATAVLAGYKKPEQCEFSRPAVMLHIPAAGRTLMPCRFDDAYIRMLADIRIPDRVFGHYVTRARLLMQNQFTFRQYMEEWDRLLKPEGLEPGRLLYDELLFSKKDRESEKKRLLLTLIIASSISRLNKKWDISDPEQMDDSRFYEILCLLSDRVMPGEILPDIVRGNPAGISRAASILNSRQAMINLENPYPHLKKYRELHKIGDIRDWLKEMAGKEPDSANIPVPPSDERNLTVIAAGVCGESTADRISEIVPVTEISDRSFRETLLRLWLQGADIPWEKLFPEGSFQKFPLPAYPFESVRHWLPKSASPEEVHPLLHQNTSDIYGLRFTSSFSGKEFFLSDHLVKGKRVLPGVAHLEMARAAVQQATGVSEEGGSLIVLEDVVWLHPVTVEGDSIKLHIRLFLQENGDMDYEIYSGSENSGEEAVIHSRGRAILHEDSETPFRDISALQGQCSSSGLTPDQYYDIFENMGITYGPGHRGMENLCLASDQVLAKLSLPASVRDTQDRFVLHPSLADSALQAWIALMPHGTSKPFLPFTLDRIEISGPCHPSMWAMLRCSNGSKSGDTIQKFDLDMCDDQGNTCVRITGLGIRPLKDDTRADESFTDAVMRVPLWRTVRPETEERFPSSSDRILIIGGTGNESETVRKLFLNTAVPEIQPDDPADVIGLKIEKHGPADHIVWIAPPANDVRTGAPDQAVIPFFRLIKALLDLGCGNSVLGWTVITSQAVSVSRGDPAEPVHAAVHGLVGSMAKEYPNWRVRLVDMEAEQAWPLPDMFALPPDPQGNPWVFRNRQWHRLLLVPLNDFVPENTLCKTNGVYVVIGGSGGIGRTWTEYMIRTYQSRIVWIGRRKKDAEIQSELDRLAAFGTAPLYVKADAADQKDMAQAYKTIKKHYPRISGVIHSAIVLSDKSLAGMDEDLFRRAFSPKADICIQIARIFQKEPLEFVMFFSSVMSFLKAPGQSNYAAGCTFKDAFARRLSQEWECPVKVMNWGYWGSVGIVAAEAHRERMERIGIGSLEPSEAMDALMRLLGGPADQIVLMKTRGYPLGQEMMDTAERALIYPEEIPSVIRNLKISAPVCFQSDADAGSLRDNVLTVLTRIASGLTGIPAEDIDSDTAFEECGLDPFLTSQFAGKLSREYDIETTPALFGEYPTFRSLANHLSNAHEDPFRKSCTKAADIPSQTGGIETERLLVRLLWGQMRSAGFFTEGTRGVAEMKKKTGVIDLYDRWFEETVAVLVRNNYLRHNGDECSVIETVPEDPGAAWQEWERLKISCSEPGFSPWYALTDTTLRSLPEILTGTVPATDIMFPNSSKTLVENIYKGNPIADYFNESLAAAVAAYIKERHRRDSSSKIRIFEIGAGTGGTSSTLLTTIGQQTDHIEEYCYTDISEAFLIHGKKVYAPGRPWLIFKIFDAEKPLREQGAAPGSYDLVIAANVLHATSDIRQALRNTKSLLKRNGLLLLNEISRNTLFFHLTFGLLKGWWLYEEPELRIPGCPGLTPATWHRILEQEGFREILFPAWNAHELGQQIIVAESDGAVQRDPRQTSVKKEKNSSGPIKTAARNDLYSAVLDRPAEEQAAQREAYPAAAPDKLAGEQSPQREDYPANTQLLKTRSTTFIRNLIAEILEIPPHQIDPSAPMEKYGIDSILAVGMADRLRKVFGDVSSTLFFEYQTVDALTDHFIKTRKETLLRQTGWESGKPDREMSGDRADISPKIGFEKNLAGAAKTESSGPKKTGRFLRFQDSEIRESNTRHDSTRDIAVIGLSGRYPGAANITQFWENLHSGRDCITEVPKTRWNHSAVFDEGINRTAGRRGGFIADADRFDPLFFNISPREAELTDPQQRIFLEESWNALEDAGYATGTLPEDIRVGVFAGSMGGDYGLLAERSGLSPKNCAVIGNDLSMLYAKIAYFLNLKGPGLTVNTACSSSLAAVHLACQSILAGESHMALAGGVFVMTTANMYILLNEAGLLSYTGKTRTFDSRADGFVPGEGAGVVVLKPLESALKDKDHIYGVIKGTGMNYDGKTNGITVPNLVSQRELALSVYEKAGINPETVTYAEAHGTATKLGDSIEFESLSGAFRKYTDKKQYCAIGSVRPNIGHTFSSACVASIIKILLSMKHKEIPCSLHFETPSEHIRLEESPFYVPKATQYWEPGEDGVIRAVVNAFGISGTNAHMVIEAYENGTAESKAIRESRIFPLSARNEERLRVHAKNTARFLKENPRLSPEDIAHTLQNRRMAMEERLAVIASDVGELAQKLERYSSTGKNGDGIHIGNARKDSERYRVLWEGETAREYIHAAMKRRETERLAYLWATGANIDWNALYDSRPSHVCLPTYPFARERYWIPVQEQTCFCRAPRKVPAEQDRPAEYPLKKEQGFAEQFYREVSEILSHELKLEKIEPDRNLAAYGMDSIMFVKVIRQINERFGLSVPSTLFFEYPDLKAFVRHICEHRDQLLKRPANLPADFSDKEKSANESIIPLSYPQKVLYGSKPHHPVYSLPLAFEIKNGLNIGHMKAAFRQLIRRHAILRASLYIDGHTARQKISAVQEPDIEVADATESDFEDIARHVEAFLKTPFDLENDPLIKLRIWQQSESDFVLLVLMHHLIADGWSYYFIAEELGAVYESLMKGEHAEERPLERTFEDYLRWQSEMLAGPGRVQLESYWLGKLSGDLPALRIPTDFPRPERLSHDGASVNFFISEEKTRLVRDFAKSEGKTIYSVLLTAYFALLRRYSGQRDIIVATMTTGRNETSFANTLGYLSGTLPLRLNITGDMTLKALLQCVFSEVIDSFKHQDYPYGLVLEKLGIPLTSEVRNIFQTMFVLQKSHIKETEALLGTWNGSWSLWHGIETRLAPLPNMGCWFDFDMEIFEIQNCLHGRLTYSSDLFREETIARMCRCFETIVDAMAADADQDIDSIVFP